MKKYFFLLVNALCLTLLMTACGETATENTNQTNHYITDHDALELFTEFEMPDKIVMPGPLGSMVIIPFDETSLVYHYDGKTEVVEFTRDQIIELNDLYGAVTEFKNTTSIDDLDVEVYQGGECHRFSAINTTQKELEDYLNLLFNYYFEGAIYPEREETADEI